jgi:alanine racemase
MSLRSKLIAAQELLPGNTVGYGSRFVAERPMRIGVVACGYADGYPRSAPNGTPVLVEGVRCGLVGRVSMDTLAVDLTPVPDARIGSEATLWGRSSRRAVLPIDEVAQPAGTVGYELMCALSARVPTVSIG